MSALISPNYLRPERQVFREEKLPQKKKCPSHRIGSGVHSMHLISLVMLSLITGLRWFLPGLSTVQTFLCSLSMPYHLEVSHSSSSHSRGGKVIGIDSNYLIKKICPFHHIYLFNYPSILLWTRGYLFCFLGYNAALILFMYLLKLFSFDH